MIFKAAFLTTIAVLRESHRIIPSLPAKARIACFISFTPTEGRLEGQINMHRHILQDLRVYAGEGRAILLQLGQGGGLCVVGQRPLTLFPRVLPLSQKMIVQPAAYFKLARQLACWGFGGLESVFHRLKHVTEYNSIYGKAHTCWPCWPTSFYPRPYVREPARERVGYYRRLDNTGVRLSSCGSYVEGNLSRSDGLSYDARERILD